jgi:hypothetical protein
MAQQTRGKTDRTSNGSRSSAPRGSRKGRGTTKPSAGARTSRKGSSSRSSRGTPTARRSRSKSSSNSGPIAAAKEATVDGAKTVGSAVTSAAKRFKTPAIAAGVGLAGLGGGIALGRGTRKTSPSRLLPLPGSGRGSTSKKLSEAVKNVGAAAEQTGQIAERVRLVSEAIGGDQTAPRRSPIEVVLEGLTRRSASAAPRS